MPKMDKELRNSNHFKSFTKERKKLNEEKIIVLPIVEPYQCKVEYNIELPCFSIFAEEVIETVIE